MHWLTLTSHLLGAQNDLNGCIAQASALVQDAELDEKQSCIVAYSQREVFDQCFKLCFVYNVISASSTASCALHEGNEEGDW